MTWLREKLADWHSRRVTRQIIRCTAGRHRFTDWGGGTIRCKDCRTWYPGDRPFTEEK